MRGHSRVCAACRSTSSSIARGDWQPARHSIMFERPPFPVQGVVSRRVSILGVLWLALGAAYIASSLGGFRSIALAIVGVMAGIVIATTGRRLLGATVGVVLVVGSLDWSDALSFVAYLPP